MIGCGTRDSAVLPYGLAPLPVGVPPWFMFFRRQSVRGTPLEGSQARLDFGIPEDTAKLLQHAPKYFGIRGAIRRHRRPVGWL